MMYDSKINQVSSLNWRWFFGLGINLVLAMQFGGASAQANELIAQPTPKTGDRVVNSNTALANLEPKILSEINRVRTDPQGYAQWLEEQQQYFDGIWLRLPGEKPIRTNRGRKALQEAISILKEQPPLPPLEISDQTAAKATSELENFATASNIQFFSYGRTTATGIVMGLVIDDLFPDRRRRNSLLSPEAENTGVVCKPDPRYAKVCAIAYSDSTATANVAEATEPPATSDSEPAAETDTEAVPEVTIDPEPVEPRSEEGESEIVPEVTVNPDLPESDPSFEGNENKPEAAPETNLTPPTNDTELATELPQPPQPQAPPASNPEAEELARVEAEIEAAPESDDATETTEEATAEEVEVPDVMVEEADESSFEEEVEEPEEVSADDDVEQVALDSDSSRLLEQVERGALEAGDRVIEEDGSLYDFYPIEGKKGETYTIYLESDEFDAFVALVDSNGNTIKENDDISQENSNSRIRVTLPEDGKYNVIVNTYDEDGSGQYVLTVTQ